MEVNGRRWYIAATFNCDLIDWRPQIGLNNWINLVVLALELFLAIPDHVWTLDTFLTKQNWQLILKRAGSCRPEMTLSTLCYRFLLRRFLNKTRWGHFWGGIECHTDSFSNSMHTELKFLKIGTSRHKWTGKRRLPPESFTFKLYKFLHFSKMKYLFLRFVLI